MDGDYAGWTADYGNFNVVDGALEFGQGYYGWPILFRSLTEADSDVSLSYRLPDIYSSLEVLSRYYHNSNSDCGTLIRSPQGDWHRAAPAHRLSASGWGRP